MKAPGEILRLIREVAGLSQSELEKLAGMPPGRVSHLETGHRGIGPKAREQLAQAFRLPVEEFMRLIQESRGDRTFIDIWLKIHSFKDKECREIIQHLMAVLDLATLAQTHGVSKDLLMNLFIQIQNAHEMAKKLTSPPEE